MEELKKHDITSYYTQDSLNYIQCGCPDLDCAVAKEVVHNTYNTEEKKNKKIHKHINR